MIVRVHKGKSLKRKLSARENDDGKVRYEREDEPCGGRGQGCRSWWLPELRMVKWRNKGRE